MNGLDARGAAAFAAAFKVKRTLLVGDDGVTVEDFPKRPVAEWLAHRLQRIEMARGRATDSNRAPRGNAPDAFETLRSALRKFAAERDWDQFHFPKNLAIALSVEAAELLEHFQWLPDRESAALPPEKRARVQEELADVLLYLIRLADKLDIDLARAAVDKMAVNAKKYPVRKARGNSKKYTDL